MGGLWESLGENQAGRLSLAWALGAQLERAWGACCRLGWLQGLQTPFPSTHTHSSQSHCLVIRGYS